MRDPDEIYDSFVDERILDGDDWKRPPARVVPDLGAGLIVSFYKVWPGGRPEARYSAANLSDAHAWIDCQFTQHTTGTAVVELDGRMIGSRTR